MLVFGKGTCVKNEHSVQLRIVGAIKIREATLFQLSFKIREAFNSKYTIEVRPLHKINHS
jgi:hypothetical protein